jgi:hypothetical protein
MIKPTAEQALRINRGSARRCGLSWRWISEAVAVRWKASRDEVEALER